MAPSRRSLEAVSLNLTEVGYLGILVGVQKDVLGLQVSVDHHVSVTVVHSRDNLLEKAASFRVLHLRDTTGAGLHWPTRGGVKAGGCLVGSACVCVCVCEGASAAAG